MDLKTLIPTVSQVTLILMVAAIGMQAHWREVIAAVRNFRGLWRAVLVVNIVVPAVAIAACLALPIDQPIRIGIVIIAVSPLAPLLTGKLMRAGMNASRTVGTYVMLVLLSVIIVPATVALISSILPPDASISAGEVAKLVSVSVLLPLAVGLLVGAWLPKLAERLAGPITLAGYVILGLLFVPVLISQAGQIVELFGNGTVLAMALTALAGIVAGHWLGGPDPVNRSALALAAATRHPGIAALIVHANFTDPRIMLSVMLFLAVSVAISAAYSLWIKKRPSGAVEVSVTV
ncbi:MAG TPA: hypothetical protein VNJ05_00415 [Sphingomicrobium sp.]|nr:hypothetical protein [Sphingomicrobium sp.]